MNRLISTTVLGVAALLVSCTGAQSQVSTNNAANGPTATPAAAQTSVGAATAAPAPATPPTMVREVEGITEYQLANGLRVLLFPDDSKSTVTVNITYFVGSKHEGYGETGMAHLLEHMVFKGTPKHPDIWKLFEEHGARFNGTTWVDRTNYFETLPASDKNLEFAIALEADRMINSTISAEDLATEFSVVRNEFERGENNPRRVLQQRMHASAFEWHNYGKSTIGNKSDIERVPVENLRRFYRKHYQPDNAMLVVAGRFDRDRALELITEHFAVLPRPERKLERTWTREPVQDGERTVMLRRVGDVGVVGLLYHALPGAHEDFAAAQALAQILVDEPAGRLYKALVETGMATSVSGWTYTWAEPGTLQVFAEVAPGKPLEPVRDKMIEIVEGLAKGDISEAEVARFRARWAKNFRLTLANSQSIAIWLTEWAALGDWRMLFLHRDRIQQLDLDRVKRVARDYLKRSNRTVGMFVPTDKPNRAPVTEVPDVAALVKDYKGKAKMAEGEKFEATVANVEARVQRSKLPNGMKMALLAKETRGDAVKIAMRLRYGSARDLRGKTAAAALMADMVQRGTKSKTYQEIRDQLDLLQAQLSIRGGGLEGGAGAGMITATVTTTRDNVVPVIDLLAELLKQ
ncbi:MAG: insulinase family protein, partial [Myxococcota bacterium]